MRSNRAITPRKELKKNCYAKSEGAVDHCNVTKSGRPKIVDSEAVLLEHQTSKEFHNSVWLVIFMTSAKTFRVTELCRKLSKYCKTFDSP